LDVAANKLEQFDLYRQADGLRAQAQRLRMDARGMSRGSQATVTPTPQPTLDQAPMLQPRPIWPTPQPQLPARPDPQPATVSPPADHGHGDVTEPQESAAAAEDHSHADDRAHEHDHAHEHGDSHEHGELTPIPAPGEPLQGDERLTPAPLRE
jgi:hypothetical protein